MPDIFASLRGFNFFTAVLRLALAMLAGGIIGYGRSKKERPAGFRTYMLISAGAAMSVLISLYDREMLQGAWAGVVEHTGEKFDAARLVSQAITGIGFLGAGIIIKTAHQQVQGLTTATGLFATVCTGIAAGVGYYELVLLSLLLIVLVLNVMSPLEGAFKRWFRNITLHVEFDSVDDINTITQVIHQQHAQIFDIDIERTEPFMDQSPSATFTLKLGKQNASHLSILSSLAELNCVRSVQELIG